MSNALSAANLAKFVVIASASRGSETSAGNMQRTAKAHMQLSHLGRSVKNLEMVTGFYREQGMAEGSYEQSFAFGVNTAKTLDQVVKLFCDEFEQECVLVWNRDSDSVWLYSTDGMTQLGHRGMRKAWSSLAAAEFNNATLSDAYTIAADGSVWEVR